VGIVRLLSLLVLFACTPPLEETHRLEAAPLVEGEGLRVVGWNTWGVPYRDDHEALRSAGAEALAALAPDVVALQEVWAEDDAQAFAEVLDAAGLVHEVHHASDAPLGRGSSGLMVASRFPIRSSRFTPFRSGALPWWPWPPDWYATKGILEVVVDTPEGPLRVMNTHLHAAYDSGKHEAERLGQTLELVRALEPTTLPTVVLGDVNSEPGELPHEVLFGSVPLEHVAQCFVDVIAVVPGDDTTLRPARVAKVLDDEVDLGSRRSVLSDHAGLLAELVRAPREAPEPTLRPDVATSARAMLEAEGERAVWHAIGGHALTLAAILFGLVAVRRRRRGRALRLLFAALVLAWSSYHAWVLGPEQHAATVDALSVLDA